MSLERAAVAPESSPAPALTQVWRRVRISAALHQVIVLLSNSSNIPGR